MCATSLFSCIAKYCVQPSYIGEYCLRSNYLVVLGNIVYYLYLLFKPLFNQRGLSYTFLSENLLFSIVFALQKLLADSNNRKKLSKLSESNTFKINYLFLL